MFLILDVNHSKLISYQPKDCSPHFYVHSKNCYVLTQTTENCITTVEGAACYKPRKKSKKMGASLLITYKPSVEALTQKRTWNFINYLLG